MTASRTLLVAAGLVTVALSLAACGPKRPEPVKTDERVSRKVRVFLLAPSDGGPSGAALSKGGQLRALALPSELPLADIDLIIAGSDAATKATLEPIRSVTGVDLQSPADGPEETARQILAHRQETLLVVVPKSDLRALMRELRVKTDALPQTEEELGALFEIRVLPKATKTRRKNLAH